MRRDILSRRVLWRPGRRLRCSRPLLRDSKRHQTQDTYCHTYPSYTIHGNSPSSNRQSSIDLSAAYPDFVDPACVSDILQRICIKQNEVRPFSLLQGSKILRDAQTLGSVGGCCL